MQSSANSDGISADAPDTAMSAGSVPTFVGPFSSLVGGEAVILTPSGLVFLLGFKMSLAICELALCYLADWQVATPAWRRDYSLILPQAAVRGHRPRVGGRCR